MLLYNYVANYMSRSFNCNGCMPFRRVDISMQCMIICNFLKYIMKEASIYSCLKRQFAYIII